MLVIIISVKFFIEVVPFFFRDVEGKGTYLFGHQATVGVMKTVAVATDTQPQSTL